MLLLYTGLSPPKYFMNALHDKPPAASAPERSGSHLEDREDVQEAQVVPDEGHIHSLLQKTGMWRASSLDCDYRQGIATGFHQLDEKLAGHGWPSDAITEFLLPRSGIGELRLVMPALAHLSRSESRWQVWVSPPHIPYAPALVQAGVRLDRQLIIQPQSEEDRLWVLSKALESGACSLVMAWPDRMRPEQIRRLQVACRDGQCAGILFRADQYTQTHSPAELRIRLLTDIDRHDIGSRSKPRPDSTHDNKHSNNRIGLQILKRRGGWAPSPFEVRLGDALGGRPDNNAHEAAKNENLSPAPEFDAIGNSPLGAVLPL